MEKTKDNNVEEILNIEAANRLIAEFMEYGQHGPLAIKNEQRRNELINIAIKEGRMAYNKSWDWLMPVVEKIEATTVPSNGVYTVDESEKIVFAIFIFKRCCDVQMDNTNADHLIEITAAKNKITAVWQAVVEFIQWYNENKSNTESK